jgi:hypothetical protein
VALRFDYETFPFLLFLGVFPTPRPPHASACRGRHWSAGSEGLQPELGEAFLAGALVDHITFKRVISDAADRGELIDHQSDRRILRGARCGLVLADLAAGIDDAVRDAARIAGAGIDDHEGVPEPAAVGGE